MDKKQAKDFDTHFFMECNPNIYPDAFHATVFVKVSEKSRRCVCVCIHVNATSKRGQVISTST